jgi:hypothetical protein
MPSALAFAAANSSSVNTPLSWSLASSLIFSTAGRRLRFRRRLRTRLRHQLHFDLVVSTKFMTELTTLAELVAIAAICVAEGLDGSAVTALWSPSTDDLIAPVSVGKSLLAALTSDVASLSIFFACVCSPLIPPPRLMLVRPLIEFSRLVRAEHYDGLLLPQPARAISAMTATTAPTARVETRPRVKTRASNVGTHGIRRHLMPPGLVF